MSSLMGGGDSGYSASPGSAPGAPSKNSKKIAEYQLNKLRKMGGSNSYAKALLYQSGATASAPSPTKSHTAQLFARGM